MNKFAGVNVPCRLQLSDTDASGRWSASAAIRLAEIAEQALLSELGVLDEIYEMEGGQFVGGPRGLAKVHLDVDLLEPAYYNQMVDVALSVAEVGRTSVTFVTKISHQGAACAQLEVVAVRRGADGQPRRWTDRARRLLLRSGRPSLEVVG